jgi:hypothetical protein
MKVRSRIMTVLVLGLLLGSGASATMSGSRSVTATASGKDSAMLNRVAFNQEMRKLWEDHIIWTRLYIVSVAGNLPDQAPTAARLFQNQVDIGNAIKPFYGDAAGNQLAGLLHDHIALAAQLLAAAKAGDANGVATTTAAWYANASQIAAFLQGANPKNWPLSAVQPMMKEHLDLTLREAVDRLQGNFAADIADYEQVHLAILTMADMLSSGIIAQFPEKFADSQA